MAQVRSGAKAFFAMLMTNMSHYPYTVIGEPTHYQSNEALNRYLSALRTSDQAIGDIVNYLKASGHLDSTLIVIVSDNGEAFGQHGNLLHASGIFEENMRIPLIMINRQLFRATTSMTVGGVTDIAPTIFDILGIPLPASWQGHSLFSNARPERVYFFCPWNGFLFGYREKDTKVIFNARSGEFSVYDLSLDREEKTNIADRLPSIKESAIQHLAAWVQYQNHMMSGLISGSPDEARPANGETTDGAKAAVEAETTEGKQSGVVDDNATPFTVPFASGAPRRATAYDDPVRNFEIGFDPSAKSTILLSQMVGSAKSGNRPYVLDLTIADLGGSQWVTVDRVHGRLQAAAQYRISVTLEARLAQPSPGQRSTVELEFSVPQSSGSDFRSALGSADLTAYFQSFTFSKIVTAAELKEIDWSKNSRVILFLPLLNGFSLEIARYDVFVDHI
jgi:Sulfatase